MAQVLVTDSYLTGIANGIRDRLGVSTQYTPAQMENAIRSIPVGGAAAPILQTKTISPSSTAQTVTADNGYDGLSAVNINAVQSTTLNVNANGTYNATNGNFYSSVVVAIADSEVNLQAKTATPSNVPISITPDTGYHGLSSVTVNPIPSSYADITNVTATSNDVLQGKLFVDSNGTPRQGLLVTSSYYIGSSNPSSSLGEDGDLYLKI